MQFRQFFLIRAHQSQDGLPRSRAEKRKLIDDTLATLPTESKEAAPENIFVPHNIIDEDDIGKYRDVRDEH